MTDSRFEIYCLTVGMLGTNGFVVRSGKDAIVVDPGDEPERFEKVITDEELNLHAILLTHGHGDHIGAVAALKDIYPGAGIYCHDSDADMLRKPSMSLGALLGMQIPPSEPEKPLEHNQKLNFGDLNFEVVHVPGHTQGHVVFKFESDVIVGDTLFQGGIGRWDLPGGDYHQLIQSIKRELLTLPSRTKVWPGHGSTTTIGEELAGNPFLNERPL